MIEQNNIKDYNGVEAFSHKDSFVSRYKGFSCPQENLDEDFLVSIAVEHSKKTVRNFLSQYNYLLDQHNVELKEVIIGWLNKKEGNFDTVWDLAFGYILDDNIKNEKDVIQAMVTFALHLSLNKFSGQWSVKLEEPIRLKYGNWLLPLCDELKVLSLKQNQKIELNYKNRKLEFDEFSQEVDNSYLLPQITYKDSKITVLPEVALQSAVFDDIRTEIASASSWDNNIQVFQNALELIDEYANIYYLWVKRVIKAVIPLQAPQTGIVSGTNFTRPGVLEMSLPCKNLIELAEILVHEASHQYMTLLCRIGEIDDGSDTNLYYSPIKKSYRPIKAIVIAYHAIGNMLLFYRLCRKKGLNSIFVQTQESLLSSQAEELEQILRTTNALTAIGKNLWEPLANHIKITKLA